ncbi:MAG: hypothetical protein HQK60_08370 [Deltaproteobacteria bacterium]|nr:hypothetical protein [Deltaproteobacteria bacterium]
MKQDDITARVAIIEAVKTPLGFFTLGMLVAEGGLGVLTVRLEGQNQTYALLGTIGCLVLLILVVTFIAIYQPEILKPTNVQQNESCSSALHELTEFKKIIKQNYDNSISLYIGENQIRMQGDFLKTDPLPFEKIKAIILFVSRSEVDKGIESLLAYRSLERLAKVGDNQQRAVWLLHGDIDTKEKSSYDNTGKLKTKFSSANLNIIPKQIQDINNLHEVFQVINKIADDSPDHNLKRTDIVCDYSAGPKALSIGMAFECLGNLRLAYFPQDGSDTYLEIDTNHFLYSIFVQRRLINTSK